MKSSTILFPLSELETSYLGCKACVGPFRKMSQYSAQMPALEEEVGRVRLCVTENTT